MLSTFYVILDVEFWIVNWVDQKMVLMIQMEQMNKLKLGALLNHIVFVFILLLTPCKRKVNLIEWCRDMVIERHFQPDFGVGW